MLGMISLIAIIGFIVITVTDRLSHRHSRIAEEFFDLFKLNEKFQNIYINAYDNSTAKYSEADFYKKAKIWEEQFKLEIVGKLKSSKSAAELLKVRKELKQNSTRNIDDFLPHFSETIEETAIALTYEVKQVMDNIVLKEKMPQGHKRRRR